MIKVGINIVAADTTDRLITKTIIYKFWINIGIKNDDNVDNKYSSSRRIEYAAGNSGSIKYVSVLIDQ